MSQPSNQPAGKTVVYDGRNLMLEAGTGIATYARLTAAVARDLGYATQLLTSTNGFVRGGASNLGEIALFDALTQTKPNALHRYWLKGRWLVGAPGGIKPVAIRRSGAVHVGGDRLSGFDVVHAAPSLFDVARMHFMRHRRRLDVHLSEPAALHHATHATPIKVAGCANIYTIHDLVPLRARQSCR